MFGAKADRSLRATSRDTANTFRIALARPSIAVNFKVETLMIKVLVKAAKALNLNFPITLQGLADEVIE
jgi:hypothetical protein